jgi:uncharacterized damage-inducible protein DinB
MTHKLIYTSKVNKVSQKIETIKAFAMLGFDRLDRVTKDLTEEQLDWKSCKEANTIRWIMTHLSSELHTFIPKIIKGDKDYMPKGWPEDYVGNKSYSLKKIKDDIKDGKEKFVKTLDSLTEADLEEPLDWFYGKQPKQMYLMLAVSEILHHEGQIAAILGVEKRMKGT